MIGDPNNINLTEEYLQERVSKLRIDEEEKQQTSVITGFGYVYLTKLPIHKTFQWNGLIKTDEFTSSSAGI